MKRLFRNFAWRLICFGFRLGNNCCVVRLWIFFLSPSGFLSFPFSLSSPGLCFFVLLVALLLLLPLFLLFFCFGLLAVCCLSLLLPSACSRSLLLLLSFLCFWFGESAAVAVETYSLQLHIGAGGLRPVVCAELAPAVYTGNGIRARDHIQRPCE